MLSTILIPIITVNPLNLSFNNFKYSIEYIEQFWVGLLEGDGTITVDKQKNCLRVRIVISLLNSKENFEMLTLITEIIGGRVIIERKDKYVTWIASNKSHLIKAFGILAKYPLLTSRKQLQLNFALRCLSNPDLENFVKNRNDKYNNINSIRILTDPKWIPYFKAWLSGFIEAEGNFSLLLRNTESIKKCNFNIGQNTDKNILELIKNYFNCSHVITMDTSNKDNVFKHYRISISGPSFRLELLKHFNEYPLLGSKRISYINWINYFVRRGKL